MQTNVAVVIIILLASEWSAVFTVRRLALVALARLAALPGTLKGITSQTPCQQSASPKAGADATLIIPGAVLFKVIPTLPTA